MQPTGGVYDVLQAGGATPDEITKVQIEVDQAPHGATT